MQDIRRGAIVAGAAALLVLSGSVAARAEEKTGGETFCSGINACKGQSVCASGGSACAGKNACKGLGILKADPAKCEKLGGKVVPDPREQHKK